MPNQLYLKILRDIDTLINICLANTAGKESSNQRHQEALYKWLLVLK
jgi:hypothetical protein